MAYPYSDGLLRQPPLSRNDSAASSAFNAYAAVPSFRDFAKRTPPPDPAKPLPPTPLIPRRASSTSPPRSRTPSSYAGRRSSSVYSRTISHWGDDSYNWTPSTFADDHFPPLPPIRPLVHSASTPQLGESASPPDLLQPRTYNPLILTPSPTESQATTPSSLGQTEIVGRRPKLPSRPAKKVMQTVSLEQAKATINAPGAVHLLPEELRAQKLNRSRSHEPLLRGSLAIFNGEKPPEAPQAPTLVDNQGRHRSLLGPDASALQYRTKVATEYPFPPQAALPFDRSSKDALTDRLFIDDTVPSSKLLRPIAPDKALRADVQHSILEDRGRSRIRPARPEENARFNGKDDTYRTTNHYRELVSKAEATRSPSEGNHDTDSDDSIKDRMKLVPQPLNTKPPAKLPGTVSGRSDHVWSFSRSNSDGRIAIEHDQRQSSGSSKESLPFGFTFGATSSWQRRSTSGEITISPPSMMPFRAGSLQSNTTDTSSSFRRESGESRASLYYPHIAPRKQSKSKSRPVMKNSKSSPLGLSGSGKRRDQDVRRRSSASDKLKQPLFQRVAKGAAKYADLLTGPSELQDRQYGSSTAAAVRSDSPHLISSPLQSAPVQAHLGWSNQAKTAFDEARYSIQSPRRLLAQPSTPTVPEFTHIATPARPLDETRIGLADPETPRRKGSIFGGMLGSWKDNRAEKRREELKKVIKVVPNTAGAGPGTMQRHSSASGGM